MSDPLRLSFEVACAVPRAFELWTAEISRWWPADHTVSGERDADVVLETRPGGRIFERTSSGAEHDWGEVTAWEPPRRLVYLWHLRADRADATEVEVTFAAIGDAATGVQIEHRGWERLGAGGAEWREANGRGWNSLLPYFAAACAEA